MHKNDRASRLPFLSLAVVVAVVLTAIAANPVPQASSQLSVQQDGGFRVRIIEGETFVVPAGAVLVVRTLGTTGGGPFFPPVPARITLKADGRPVLIATAGGSSNPLELAFGASFSAGEAVEVCQADLFVTDLAVAFGFLAEQ